MIRASWPTCMKIVTATIALVTARGDAALHYASVSANDVRATVRSPVSDDDSTEYGTVRGRVFDERGAAMSNISVQLTPGDLHRTSDAMGAFAFDSLQPGRYLLVAKTVGRGAVATEVTVASGEVANIAMKFGTVQRLDTVITLDAIKSKDRIEYERRRAAHRGYALDGKKLAERADSFSALSTFPRVQLTRKGFGVAIKMQPSRCLPTAFLDGMKVDMELATSLPIDQLRAIEVFTHPMDAPPEYHLQGGCALFLFWSMRHKW